MLKNFKYSKGLRENAEMLVFNTLIGRMSLVFSAIFRLNRKKIIWR